MVALGQLDVRREHGLERETEVETAHLREAVQQQAGPHQDDERERHLRGGNRPARQRAAGAAAQVVHRRAEARRAERRPEADGERDEHHERAGDPERQPAQVQVAQGGGTERPLWGEGADEAQLDLRDGQPRGAREQREGQALGDQLAHQAPARCARCQAHRDLVRAAAQPRVEEVCDVDAGDQQHAADRGDEDEQEAPHLGRRAGLQVGRHRDADAVSAAESRREAELLAGGRRRRIEARQQALGIAGPDDDPVPEGCRALQPAREGQERGGGHRHPEVGVLRKTREAPRRDSDDLERPRL